VARSLGTPQRLQTPQEAEDDEQEPADQDLLAALGSGPSDSTVGRDRALLVELIRFLDRPVWTTQPHDADRFLVLQRRQPGRARLTVQHSSG
jgi:hypothetical protein